MQNKQGLISGEISSVVLFNRLVRKETSFTSGGRYYRFTLDPGLHTEFATCWSVDEEKLYRHVVKRIKLRIKNA